MPLLQYFRWVGSFLLTALLAASWWFPGNVAGEPPSRAPLSERTSPKRKTALLRFHPGVSREARAFTAPNPFHRLPGKS